MDQNSIRLDSYSVTIDSCLMRRDSRLKEHIGLVSVNVRLLKVLQSQTSSDQRTRLVQIFKFGSGLQLVFHTYHFQYVRETAQCTNWIAKSFSQVLFKV